MGRGVSSGGGQSSLGYLFGSGGEPPKPAANNSEAPKAQAAPAESNGASQKPAAAPAAAQPADVTKQIPAGIQASKQQNNYYRADGQNSGNFLTVRLLWLFIFTVFFSCFLLPPIKYHVVKVITYLLFIGSAFNKSPCCPRGWFFSGLPVWRWQ